MVPGAGRASRSYRCEECGVIVDTRKQQEQKPEPIEGKWVMTSHVTRDPHWQLDFYIGAVHVAHISFISKGVAHLEMDCAHGLVQEQFTGDKAVSHAMRRMHELLKSPPDLGPKS